MSMIMRVRTKLDAEQHLKAFNSPDPIARWGNSPLSESSRNASPRHQEAEEQAARRAEAPELSLVVKSEAPDAGQGRTVDQEDSLTRGRSRS